jgi:hypothetical protein
MTPARPSSGPMKYRLTWTLSLVLGLMDQACDQMSSVSPVASAPEPAAMMIRASTTPSPSLS